VTKITHKFKSTTQRPDHNRPC